MLVTYPVACAACGNATHALCDECKLPHCSHGACLFLSGEWLTFPSDPRDEYYAENPTWSREEELCLQCYTKRLGHAPLVLWDETSIASTLLLVGPAAIHPGASTPAGGGDSWYRPPTAGTVLALTWGDQKINLDAFRLVQLLNVLKAHEPAIRAQAKATSDVLVPMRRRDTERAIEADSGHIDYSQYE